MLYLIVHTILCLLYILGVCIVSNLLSSVKTCKIMLANNVHVYSPNPRCLLHMHDDPTVHSVFMKLLGPEEAAHARIETVDSFQVRQQAS